MAKTKATRESPPAKSGNAKARKATKTTKTMSPSERAAAVDKNIGKTQSLHDFLAGIGWR